MKCNSISKIGKRGGGLRTMTLNFERIVMPENSNRPEFKGVRPRIQKQLIYSINIGIPIKGQITSVKNPNTTINRMLAGIPAMKNSPVVNCLLS